LRALIRKRLEGTRPQDPKIVQRPGWGDIPDAFMDRLPKPLIPAAVLLPLVERADDLHILLTQRAEHLKHHAGQISFPGGRVEIGDNNPSETALRETAEEVGVPADRVEVVGYLDNYFTITGYSVTPVVGFFDNTISLRLDSAEVEDAFEVPLSHLFEPANHHKKQKEIFGQRIPYYEIPWQDRIIWGATASMIVCFYKAILGADNE